jgi:hypothetical protein
VASVEIPRVTSAVEARQEGQVLEGLGVIGVAQMQQRIVQVVPWFEAMGVALAISIGFCKLIALWCQERMICKWRRLFVGEFVLLHGVRCSLEK